MNAHSTPLTFTSMNWSLVGRLQLALQAFRLATCNARCDNTCTHAEAHSMCMHTHMQVCTQRMRAHLLRRVRELGVEVHAFQASHASLDGLVLTCLTCEVVMSGRRQASTIFTAPHWSMNGNIWEGGKAQSTQSQAAPLQQYWRYLQTRPQQLCRSGSQARRNMPGSKGGRPSGSQGLTAAASAAAAARVQILWQRGLGGQRAHKAPWPSLPPL